MAKAISTRGIQPQRQLFHNKRLDVYPTEVKFEDIVFWPENYRTILPFDLLEAQKGKVLSKISLPEITEFLAQRPDLELVDLADSIARNGVRVPLIVLDDGTLLDGNRRYFACSYLLHRAELEKQARPQVLDEIPVLVIKSDAIDERTRFKILAEANYVRDFKVEWPLDVKAGVINHYFHNCLKEGRMTEDQAYDEIKDVFGEDRSKVDAYVESVSISNEFINSVPAARKNEFRERVQGKFLYFWEFRNKALRGRAPLDSKGELPKVKKLFFKMIETDRFNNFKQVEPMIRAVRDDYTWELLASSQGSKIDQVEALYKEQKAIRSAEDKIRNFLRWLRQENPQSFTKAAMKLLEELASLVSKALGRQK
ncbi:MAG: ParB N-terminal domain-containing protein [Verrucomicrobia bacterium]|nr:ParB N-terminal domain-containing protein [Verrucomicrobiota bacterium]